MTGPCSLCSHLAGSRIWHDDADAPEGFASLVAVTSRSAHEESLRRCPACRTYFSYGADDATLGGPTRPRHRLRRLHPLEALGSLDGEEKIALEGRVAEWPRQDLVDLLKAHRICLKGTARAGSITFGRTVFYADELFFHVRLSPDSKDAPQVLRDLCWFDKAEFAEWIAKEYEEKVSTQIIGRYSDVPPAVLAEAPRRARRVDVALGLLFGGSRWLRLESLTEFLRHNYSVEWHVVAMSGETIAGVTGVSLADARSRVFERLKDASELETEPTPPGIGAAVDALLERAP